MQYIADFFTSNIAWVYLVAGELGLLFRILIRTVQDRRFINFFDVYQFLVWSIFVATVAIFVDQTPAVSFLIGLGALEIYPVIQKSASSFKPFSLGIVEVLFKGFLAGSVTPEKVEARAAEVTKIQAVEAVRALVAKVEAAPPPPAVTPAEVAEVVRTAIEDVDIIQKEV